VKERRASARWLAAEALLDRSVLGADPSACYLHGGDQTCAKQQETGRLRCHLSDLASDLSVREVGVVNVGVRFSAVQGGDKASFRQRSGSTFLGDEGRSVGASEGQINRGVERTGRGIWERGERNRHHFVDSHRTAAMNVRCACGSGQAGERFSDRQQITAEGEDANSCCWTSSRGDLIGSQQDGAVDSIGVGGDDWGESKGKGKEDGPGEDDTFEQRVLLPRWGGNRLDGIEYGQLPRSQNRLTKGSCAIEKNIIRS